LNAKAILTDFNKHKKMLAKAEIHELAALNEAMFRTIEVEDNAETVKTLVQQLELYIRWLRENGRNEPLAHWTTLYQTDAYPKTKVAALSHSPYIFKNMVEFIKDIKI
jgi:LytS/YehU family sensor histidine kinase